MLTRGNKGNVDHYIHDLQCQMFKHKLLIDGKEYNTNVQLGVRPIQLWEVVFPKETLKEVLAVTSGKSNSNEFEENTNPRFSILRKALRCKKIPKDLDLKDNMDIRTIFNEHIAVYPFGIKEDGVWGKGSKFEGTELL